MKDMPLFVKVDKYEDVADTMNAVKAKVNEIKAILSKITEFKNNEDTELELWQTTMNDIEKKMLYADSILLQTQE